MIGLSREVARELGLPVSHPHVRQAAWLLANGGFGLSLEIIGRVHGLQRQTIHEGVQRTADRCDETRSFERALMRVADVFEVSL